MFCTKILSVRQGLLKVYLQLGLIGILADSLDPILICELASFLFRIGLSLQINLTQSVTAPDSAPGADNLPNEIQKVAQTWPE